MIRRLTLFAGSAILAATVILAASDAHEPGGSHGGGYHGGGYHGDYHPGGARYGGFYYPHNPYAYYGPYRPGLYAPYGYYRPYYNYYAFGTGLGLGLGVGGLGLGGLGGYGLGGYGLGGYGVYQPYYGGVGVGVAPPAVVAGQTASPPLADGQGGVAQTPPPPDNAAHLQLVVPENAEVLFDGGRTTQTGTTREFISPQLPAGKLFDYTITVRYNDASGKEVTDKRVIHVRANDWFRVDFTRPAPPEPIPAP